MADVPNEQPTPPRDRVDRCPGVLRPWPAEDGALVRLRLPGGRLTSDQLCVLADLADEHADGHLHLTSRANVQLRGLATDDEGAPPAAFTAALEDAGLLPSRAHDLVRNLACSPFTGLRGGLADLRPVLADLDAALLADDDLTALPGKFLLALDDGAHDVATAGADLLAVVEGRRSARLVVGGLDAGACGLADVVASLLRLAHAFLAARGTGPDAPWHVAELRRGGRELVGGRPAWSAPPSSPVPLGLLDQDDGGRLLHLAVPGGELPTAEARRSAGRARAAVVTPWRTLVLPDVAS